MNGRGAVVGNECEFAVGKTKSLSQAGWLAPLLLLSSSSGRTERERVMKDFLVSSKSNVIFLFPIFPLSIYANLLMPRLCFQERTPSPPPSPLFPTFHSYFGKDFYFYFPYFFGQDVGNVFYSTIYCMYRM